MDFFQTVLLHCMCFILSTVNVCCIRANDIHLYKFVCKYIHCQIVQSYICKYLHCLASFRSILSLSIANISENRTDEIYMYLKHKTYPQGYGNNIKKEY